MSIAGGVPQVTESIGHDFDGNRDGALKGVEKWAFLNELMSQLGAAGPGRSVSGADSVFGRSGADQLDLSQVVWLHENVSGWPQTSTITGTSIGDPPISIEHTKSGLWPRDDFSTSGVIVDSNAWVFANIDGTWHAATWEWFKPGQTSKNLGAVGFPNSRQRCAPIEQLDTEIRRANRSNSESADSFGSQEDRSTCRQETRWCRLMSAEYRSAGASGCSSKGDARYAGEAAEEDAR